MQTSSGPDVMWSAGRVAAQPLAQRSSCGRRSRTFMSTASRCTPRQSPAKGTTCDRLSKSALVSNLLGTCTQPPTETADRSCSQRNADAVQVPKRILAPVQAQRRKQLNLATRVTLDTSLAGCISTCTSSSENHGMHVCALPCRDGCTSDVHTSRPRLHTLSPLSPLRIHR